MMKIAPTPGPSPIRMREGSQKKNKKERDK